MRDTGILDKYLFLRTRNIYWDIICIAASYGQRWITPTDTWISCRKIIISYQRIQDTNETLMTLTQSILYFILGHVQSPDLHQVFMWLNLVTPYHMIRRTWSSFNPHTNLLLVNSVPFYLPRLGTFRVFIT
jgi:hypothetical protein